MRYTNPIIPGFYPDPSICRVGEDFYLVTSSFEYFPGVPIFHSRDLVHWRQLGHCLSRPEQLPLAKAGCSGGIYAPTIRYHAGRFYTITTNVSIPAHVLVWADDPAGPWSDPLLLRMGGIDPSLLFDDDGRVYMQATGRGGIVQRELDITTGEWRSEERMIWAGTGGAAPEAPHLYHINGQYYLMIAEGGTEYGHMETIARADNPWGPFEPCPRNPILTMRSLATPIRSTGHADLVQDPQGNWWLVCLGVRPTSYPPFHHLGRETMLTPVVWDGDGWPVIGDGGRIHLEMEGPDLPAHPLPALPARDDFDAPTLGLAWNYLRNPYSENYSLTARPGWLRLTGSALTLNDVDSPAFIGRRLQHFACQIRTRLDFVPATDGDEAGLTALMNATHHYEVALTLRAGQRVAIVRRRIGSLVVEVAQAAVADGPVTLGIDSTAEWLTFGLVAGDGTFTPLAQGETRYLATEVAGGFTGVYLGLYATGTGQAASRPADFDWFDYQPA
jgi:xylan 1,4-beta-xylosidase